MQVFDPYNVDKHCPTALLKGFLSGHKNSNASPERVSPRASCPAHVLPPTLQVFLPTLPLLGMVPLQTADNGEACLLRGYQTSLPDCGQHPRGLLSPSVR